MHLPTHNPLESHSFPAHASCFSHTNAQVLIPCHRFSVAALGLNPHTHYLSPVTVTHRRTRCHPCRTRCYSPLNRRCLLRGPKPCICHRRRRYPNLSLPPFRTSP